ncbi:MAG: EndoU domain-containing protein [Candidatus Babeliales bacterium]
MIPAIQVSEISKEELALKETLEQINNATENAIKIAHQQEKQRIEKITQAKTAQPNKIATIKESSQPKEEETQTEDVIEVETKLSLLKKTFLQKYSIPIELFEYFKGNKNQLVFFQKAHALLEKIIHLNHNNHTKTNIESYSKLLITTLKNIILLAKFNQLALAQVMLDVSSALHAVITEYLHYHNSSLLERILTNQISSLLDYLDPRLLTNNILQEFNQLRDTINMFFSVLIMIKNTDITTITTFNTLSLKEKVANFKQLFTEKLFLNSSKMSNRTQRLIQEAFNSMQKYLDALEKKCTATKSTPQTITPLEESIEVHESTITPLEQPAEAQAAPTSQATSAVDQQSVNTQVAQANTPQTPQSDTVKDSNGSPSFFQKILNTVSKIATLSPSKLLRQHELHNEQARNLVTNLALAVARPSAVVGPFDSSQPHMRMEAGTGEDTSKESAISNMSDKEVTQKLTTAPPKSTDIVNVPIASSSSGLSTRITTKKPISKEEPAPSMPVAIVQGSQGSCQATATAAQESVNSQVAQAKFPTQSYTERTPDSKIKKTIREANNVTIKRHGVTTKKPSLITHILYFTTDEKALKKKFEDHTAQFTPSTPKQAIENNIKTLEQQAQKFRQISHLVDGKSGLLLIKNSKAIPHNPIDGPFYRPESFGYQAGNNIFQEYLINSQEVIKGYDKECARLDELQSLEDRITYNKALLKAHETIKENYRKNIEPLPYEAIQTEINICKNTITHVNHQLQKTEKSIANNTKSYNARFNYKKYCLQEGIHDDDNSLGDLGQKITTNKTQATKLKIQIAVLQNFLEVAEQLLIEKRKIITEKLHAQSQTIVQQAQSINNSNDDELVEAYKGVAFEAAEAGAALAQESQFDLANHCIELGKEAVKAAAYCAKVIAKNPGSFLYGMGASLAGATITEKLIMLGALAAGPEIGGFMQAMNGLGRLNKIMLAKNVVDMIRSKQILPEAFPAMTEQQQAEYLGMLAGLWAKAYQEQITTLAKDFNTKIGNPVGKVYAAIAKVCKIRATTARQLNNNIKTSFSNLDDLLPSTATWKDHLAQKLESFSTEKLSKLRDGLRKITQGKANNWTVNPDGTISGHLTPEQLAMFKDAEKIVNNALDKKSVLPVAKGAQQIQDTARKALRKVVPISKDPMPETVVAQTIFTPLEDQEVARAKAKGLAIERIRPGVVEIEYVNADGKVIHKSIVLSPKAGQLGLCRAPGFKHVMYGEVSIHGNLKGLHQGQSHPWRIVVKNGKIDYLLKPDQHGVYKVKWHVPGSKLPKESTMIPDNWNISDFWKAIEEVYQNPIAIIKQANGNKLIIGKCNKGVPFAIVVKEEIIDSHLRDKMITAYPYHDDDWKTLFPNFN